MSRLFRTAMIAVGLVVCLALVLGYLILMMGLLAPYNLDGFVGAVIITAPLIVLVAWMEASKE